MSLESLFTDRKVRKLIRESVYNAEEINEGVCDCCKEEGPTFKMGNHTLCEKCTLELESISEDYDRAFNKTYLDINNIVEQEIINEAAWAKMNDPKKLVDEVNNKYGGDLAKLAIAYDLKPPVKGDISYVMGGADRYPFRTEELTGGNSKINRFIDDFDIVLSSRAANMLVPDPDGYSAKCASLKTPPVANTQAVSSPSSTAPKKVIPASTSAKVKGSGYSASGDDDKFEIKIADDIFIECTRTSQQNGADVYSVVLKDSRETPMQYSVAPGSIKDKADFIVKEIRETPCNIFTSFDDEFESTKGYILSEYPNYSFMFDDDSFDGKTLSLVLALNGKPFANTRIALSKKDIISKASLDGKLLRALNERLTKFYPVLFDGSMNINTSIGKAVSSLVQVDSNNVVKIHTELGNRSFEWEAPGNNLKDKEVAVNSMIDAVYAKFDKIIPDWTSKVFRKTKTVKNYTDTFEVDAAQGTVTVFLNFSLNEFYDSYDVVFHMSVLDKQSGIEQPKEFVSVIYNRPGTKLEDFAKANGEKIYKKYFNKSDMQETLSAKAQEKMSNRSKKEVFLSHVADELKIGLNKPILKDLDIDIEEFDVNSDHKVTNVVFRVSDPYRDVANDSDKLDSLLGLDKISWIKFINSDDTPKSLKTYGPSVIYKVTKVQDFAECINLPLLESAMLEAFGLVGGRKIIGVNEAYWKVINGENVLVF